MSLIMDALEKIQRETKPQIAAAEWPVVSPPPLAAHISSRKAVTDIEDEEDAPAGTSRRLIFYVIVFAGLLFTAAIIGFGKLSAGLSLPQTPAVVEPVAIREAMEAVRKPAVVGPGILRGVLQDPAGSFCILGDQILKVGDTWRGYTVLSIEARQVVVQDTQNHLLTLYLQES